MSGDSQGTKVMSDYWRIGGAIPECGLVVGIEVNFAVAGMLIEEIRGEISSGICIGEIKRSNSIVWKIKPYYYV